ncbi:MAG: prolyl oligopeptidase family serine peptidase [Pirellulaceae bacterium]
MKSRSAVLSLLAILFTCAAHSAAEDLQPIPRRLPPEGIELPREDVEKLTAELAALHARLEKTADHPLAADVAIYAKAVDFALRHREFYDKKHIPLAYEQIKIANTRLDELAADRPASWIKARGLIVRGYKSRIDDSPQPYGLVVPEKLDLDKPAPLYVWLHGRGDAKTDLHFIAERQSRVGQIAPDSAIVLHPFGRQCIGWKSAGEVDVFEAIDHVASQYKIDPRRIVLMGFSMGGAGGWHIGAHYADRFVAMSPGAGFAETARYNNIKPADYPSAIEQKMWGLYDVPLYVRNLFNLPVVAYSGELDKQIQAARVMEEAFAAEGEKLPHVIGPGMGHKYHPDSLAEILRRMDAAVEAGQNPLPKKVTLQTQTLRYGRMHWVQVLGLGQHWKDARVDAELTGDKSLRGTTKNVTRIAFSPFADMAGAEITIDGQSVEIPMTRPMLKAAHLVREDGKWRWDGIYGFRAAGERFAKRPGLQGPIDDVLMAPFLVVTPSGASPNVDVQRWVEFELAHFQQRWPALYRGELRTKRDVDVSKEDLENYHLILWGDPTSNTLLSRMLQEESGSHQLPLQWTPDKLVFAGKQLDAARHVPVLIYPNPLNAKKYVVLNSGPTFREGHDRTNSLQNPKLGDWALIDLSEPPSATAPGRIVAAGVFNEQWQGNVEKDK